MISFLELTAMECGGVEVLKVIKFVWSLLDLVFIFVPIGLIIFISLDFMKNVMAGKEDEMKKNLNLAIKRIMFCVVLFLVPVIVNLVINLLGDAEVDVITNFSDCIDMAQDEDLSQYEEDENSDEQSSSEENINSITNTWVKIQILK